MGGLSRRAYILNNIRREETKPILVFDAGAMLFPQPFISSSQLPAKKVQANGLIEAISKMGYDAFGLSPQDLPAGTDFLLQQADNVKLPWVSANLVPKDNNQPLFTPYIIKPAGDLSIGILGLTGQWAQSTKQSADINYQIVPWEKSLENTLAQLQGKTDINILLSSLPIKDNRQIAEKHPDIHLIIQSGQSTSNMSPKIYNNTLITQIGSRGKYVGRIDIKWEPSGQWEHDMSSQNKQIKERIDRINWEIGRLKRRYKPGTIEQNTRYQDLVLEKNNLSEQLAELESQPVTPPELFSTYQSRFIGLPISLAEDQEIKMIVQKTKLAVNKTNQSALTKAYQKITGGGQKAFSNMAGWKTCKPCHEPQTKFWKQTDHAKAWQTLEKANQQFNPDCLICHVTLPTYDKKKVLQLDLLTNLKNEFRGVGCETCHGPARNHTQQPDRYQPTKPNEQTCTACHTPERDDNFVYVEKLKKIRCPAAGH